MSEAHSTLTGKKIPGGSPGKEVFDFTGRCGQVKNFGNSRKWKLYRCTGNEIFEN